MVAVAGAAGVLAAACAAAGPPTDEVASLRQVTAEAIGLPSQSDITISDQQRTVAKWSWQAAAGGKRYACDADQDMRLPSCIVSS